MMRYPARRSGAGISTPELFRAFRVMTLKGCDGMCLMPLECMIIGTSFGSFSCPSGKKTRAVALGRDLDYESIIHH